MTYDRLLNKAWLKYRHDWAESRGYDFRAVSRAFYQDLEYHGEMWAYKEEFEYNEFTMEEYMHSILSPGEYGWWLHYVPEEERQ